MHCSFEEHIVIVETSQTINVKYYTIINNILVNHNFTLTQFSVLDRIPICSVHVQSHMCVCLHLNTLLKLN